MPPRGKPDLELAYARAALAHELGDARGRYYEAQTDEQRAVAERACREIEARLGALGVMAARP
jgi:hypothetical protein